MKTISISFGAWLSILVVCISIISCIAPVYVPPLHGIGLIDVSNVKPGITTKEEVFLQFGCAFKRSEDEKLFTASNLISGGYFAWVVVGPVSPHLGAFGEKKIYDMYEVEIEFHDNDVVKRCETFKLPRNQSKEKGSDENK